MVQLAARPPLERKVGGSSPPLGAQQVVQADAAAATLVHTGPPYGRRRRHPPPAQLVHQNRAVAGGSRTTRGSGKMRVETPSCGQGPCSPTGRGAVLRGPWMRVRIPPRTQAGQKAAPASRRGTFEAGTVPDGHLAMLVRQSTCSGVATESGVESRRLPTVRRRSSSGSERTSSNRRVPGSSPGAGTRHPPM